jgi:hypothetical protein
LNWGMKYEVPGFATQRLYLYLLSHSANQNVSSLIQYLLFLSRLIRIIIITWSYI